MKRKHRFGYSLVVGCLVSCVTPVEAPIYAYCLNTRDGKRVLVTEYPSHENYEECPACVELGEGRAECR